MTGERSRPPSPHDPRAETPYILEEPRKPNPLPATAIGRFVINSESLRACGEYMQRAGGVLASYFFMPIINQQHFYTLGRDDPQHIMNTWPEHPQYNPGRANGRLDCDNWCLSTRLGNDGMYMRLRLRGSKYPVPLLSEERRALLAHMGADNSKQLSGGKFYIPFGKFPLGAFRSGLERGTFMTGLEEMISPKITLGNLRVGPTFRAFPENLNEAF